MYYKSELFFTQDLFSYLGSEFFFFYHRAVFQVTFSPLSVLILEQLKPILFIFFFYKSYGMFYEYSLYDGYYIVV